MYSLLPPTNGSHNMPHTAPATPQSLNVRASWIAGAPVHGDALLTLCRPSQVCVLLGCWLVGPGGSSKRKLLISLLTLCISSQVCVFIELLAGGSRKRKLVPAKKTAECPAGAVHTQSGVRVHWTAGWWVQVGPEQENCWKPCWCCADPVKCAC